MNKRIRCLDALRGGAVFLMVLHHGAYSYKFIFGGRIDLYTPFLGIGVLFVALFFSISGVSSHLSRNNLTRGIKALAVAAVISIATFLFDIYISSGSFVAFGVIHGLGSCMIIYHFIGKYTDRLFGKITPLVYAALFILFYIITRDPVSIPHLYPLGFYDANFASSDYYPILPWIFMFFFGGSLSNSIISNKFPKWFYALEFRPLEWIGRNALAVYVIHQPIIYLLLFAISRIYPAFFS